MKNIILNKIKQAKTVHIYSHYLEMHFRISKTDFLNEFRSKCKRQKDYPEYMDSMLEEFNENINFDDNLNLFFN